MARRTRTDVDEQRDQIIEELGGEDAETTAEREAILGELEEPKRCECGCGTVVGKRSRFAVGHDMKLKARLLTRYDEGDAEAGAELIRRGWRTEADLTARSANGTATEEQKRERQRARVQAKLDRAREQVTALDQQLAALA